jgi:polygalacturonase
MNHKQIKFSAEEIENLLQKVNSDENYIYNIMEHGAVGDGNSIENNAIQALLDKALDNNGITLYFPKGVYRINGPLEIFSNTHLILDDNAIITRKKNGALLINGRYKGDAQYGNIHVEGGVWDLDNETSVYSGSVHFILGNADNFLIENCTFLNNHGNHALDIAGCENVTIRNCKFLGQMPDPDTSRYYVEAIQLAEFTQKGQPSWGGNWNDKPCKHVLIDNCLFDKNVKNELYNYGYGCAVGNHSSYESTGSSDIRITNCNINNCEFGLRPCCWHNTVIENCSIYNCTDAIHLTSCAKSEAKPDKHSPLTNTIINNCTIIDSKKYDIWGRGKFAYDNPEDISYLDGLVINNCKFKGCNGVDSLGSIYLDVCNNIRINNNIFENTARATWFSSCKNIIVCNNFGENINTEGTFVSNTTLVEEEYKPDNENLKILNNTFKNCGRNGLLIQYVNDFVVSNNTIKNCAIDNDYERNGILINNTAINGFVVNNIVEGEHHNYDIEVFNKNDNNIVLKDNLAANIFQ